MDQHPTLLAYDGVSDSGANPHSHCRGSLLSNSPPRGNLFSGILQVMGVGRWLPSANSPDSCGQQIDWVM